MDRKNIPNPGFAADDGSADPVLAAALADWARDPAAGQPCWPRCARPG